MGAWGNYLSSETLPKVKFLRRLLLWTSLFVCDVLGYGMLRQIRGERGAGP
jgi:hypothetical protein